MQGFSGGILNLFSTGAAWTSEVKHAAIGACYASLVISSLAYFKGLDKNTYLEALPQAMLAGTGAGVVSSCLKRISAKLLPASNSHCQSTCVKIANVVISGALAGVGLLFGLKQVDREERTEFIRAAVVGSILGLGFFALEKTPTVLKKGASLLHSLVNRNNSIVNLQNIYRLGIASCVLVGLYTGSTGLPVDIIDGLLIMVYGSATVSGCYALGLAAKGQWSSCAFHLASLVTLVGVAQQIKKLSQHMDAMEEYMGILNEKIYACELEEEITSDERHLTIGSTYVGGNPLRDGLSQMVDKTHEEYARTWNAKHIVVTENLLKLQCDKSYIDPSRVDCVPYWNKVAVLREWLSKPQNNFYKEEWRWMLDDDAPVTDMTVNPREAIDLMRRGKDTSIIVAADVQVWNGDSRSAINTGILIVRKDEASRNFIEKLWNKRNAHARYSENCRTLGTCQNQDVLHEQQGMADLIEEDYSLLDRVITVVKPRDTYAGGRKLAFNVFERSGCFVQNKAGWEGNEIDYQDPENGVWKPGDWIGQTAGVPVDGWYCGDKKAGKPSGPIREGKLKRMIAATVRNKDAVVPAHDMSRLGASLPAAESERFRFRSRLIAVQSQGEQLLSEVNEALSKGGKLVPFSVGSFSGLYVIVDESGQKIALFKPEDERNWGPQNRQPDHRRPDASLERIRQHKMSSFEQGMTVRRQFLANLLDVGGVMPTGIKAQFSSTDFVDVQSEAAGQPPRLQSKVGYLQKWIADSRSLASLHPAAVPQPDGQIHIPKEAFDFYNHGLLWSVPLDEFQKVAILDIVLHNEDRHPGNILVRYDEKHVPHLIPIDCDAILPWTLGKLTGLYEHQRALEPFSKESLKFIEALNPDDIWEMVNSQSLPEQAAVNAKKLTIILKKMAAAGKSLYDIYRFITTADSAAIDSMVKE